MLLKLFLLRVRYFNFFHEFSFKFIKNIEEASFKEKSRWVRENQEHSAKDLVFSFLKKFLPKSILCKCFHDPFLRLS